MEYRYIGSTLYGDRLFTMLEPLYRLQHVGIESRQFSGMRITPAVIITTEPECYNNPRVWMMSSSCVPFASIHLDSSSAKRLSVSV